MDRLWPSTGAADGRATVTWISGCVDPELAFRIAVLDDAEGLAHCIVESWLDAHRGQVPDEQWERRRTDWSVRKSAAAWRRTLSEIDSADSSAHVLVAEDRDGVVGLIMGSTRRGEPGQIDALYVAPGRQRSGIGGRLLSMSLDMLGSAGVAIVDVSVLAANGPARRFYEHTGATLLTSTEIDEDGEPLPGFVYRWALAP